MEHLPLESSNLESAGYDDDTATLEVAFKNGSVYQYFDVPRHVFDGLMAADSPGGYHHREIRDVYRYRQV